ncbi:MAG: hypothetical protein ACXAEF_09615, partial [Candidatus Thorarchaeota archaeon]
MTTNDEVDPNMSARTSPIRWFITRRRQIRRKINSSDSIDRTLHLYASIVLLLNIILILYTMISLTSRLLLSGVPLIDSIPLAFYILPLMIFLPKLLLDFHRTRSGLLTIVILLIVTIVFGMISALVRGFIILMIVNAVSVVTVFILGRFRPSGSLKSIGRKGVAWLLILNSLGLMLPISITIMGQYPIGSASYSDTSEIFFEMPLASFEYDYVNITPDASFLSDFEPTGFGLDLRVNSFVNESLLMLDLWLTALSSTNIPFRITSSGAKDAYLARDPTLLGNTELLAFLYGHHWSALSYTIDKCTELGISTENLEMSFDMTLSQTEWISLMNKTRNVNLQGFSELVRNSLDSIDSTMFPEMVLATSELANENSINLNLIVEGFVIDDLLDDDATMMKLCGISPEVISILGSEFEVLCDRSRYSEGMAGDVGEYLV